MKKRNVNWDTFISAFTQIVPLLIKYITVQMQLVVHNVTVIIIRSLSSEFEKVNDYRFDLREQVNNAISVDKLHRPVFPDSAQLNTNLDEAK